jgi:hypothetical protein
MKKFSEWIHRISKGWVVLASLALFVLFAILVLPQQASAAEEYSGDLGSPDTSFFYTAQQLYQFADGYGPEGRAAYIRARVTFDVVFPLVYAFFLTTTISWVFTRANLQNKFWMRLNLVPILGLFFDYLENASTSIVMNRYPEPTMVIDTLAGIFTSIKWVFVGGSFVILLFGMIITVLQKLLKK